MLERRQERGLDTPAMDRRPELPEDLEWIMALYVEASSGRQAGFGPSPLLWIEIGAVLGENGIMGEERQYARTLIRRMDQAVIEWHAKRYEAQTKRLTREKK